MDGFAHIEVFYKSCLWMTILYMFCASFLIKYSVNIMQSVNIHVIKIVNKTCRCFIKILDLICTFSKLFFFFLIFFFFLCLLKSFIFFSCKAANTSERSHETWEVTSFPSGVPNLPLTTMCNSFAFSKAQFLMKWCVNFSPITTRPNGKVVNMLPTARRCLHLQGTHMQRTV